MVDAKESKTEGKEQAGKSASTGILTFMKGSSASICGTAPLLAVLVTYTYRVDVERSFRSWQLRSSSTRPNLEPSRIGKTKG